MEAHLRVQGTHALKDVHSAAIQSPVNREAVVTQLTSEVNSAFKISKILLILEEEELFTVRICEEWPAVG